MAGRVNIQALRKSMEAPARQFVGLARINAQRIFEREKDVFFDEFDSHNVTQELKAGPYADSFYLYKGNLFSLLGFFNGDSPIENLRERLEEGFVFDQRAIISYTNGKINFSFRVYTPSFQNIEQETYLPWKNKSWIEEIEDGVTGLTFYVYGIFSKGSRSSSGLQRNPGDSESESSERLDRIPYIKSMLRKISKRFS